MSATVCVEPLPHSDVSFAGNASRKSISNLQFAPTINYFSFPDSWFFALFPEPDIRGNFGPAVTGQTRTSVSALRHPRWAQFTKVHQTLTVSLEVGVPIIDQYPVYDFKTELRVDMKV
jgi:hypothetical protein